MKTVWLFLRKTPAEHPQMCLLRFKSSAEKRLLSEKSGVYGVALDLLGKRGLLTHGAVVALEHSDKIAAPQAEGFEIYTDRKYGSSMVAILKYV